MRETEWTDKFGTHLEIAERAADGRIFSVVLTKQAYGWQGIEEARAEVFRAAAVYAAQPAPPWPSGSDTNCKREGWRAYFAGRGREACPFPPGRADLQRGYREGWDAAAAQGQPKP